MVNWDSEKTWILKWTSDMHVFDQTNSPSWERGLFLNLNHPACYLWSGAIMPPLAGKKLLGHSISCWTSPEGWRCLTALKRIGSALLPLPGEDTCQILPHLSPARLWLICYFWASAGHLVNWTMIIIFGCSALSLGRCSKAWEFCRLATSDLWNPFILANCRRIQHLHELRGICHCCLVAKLCPTLL